jgi:hypothetical protein
MRAHNDDALVFTRRYLNQQTARPSQRATATSLVPVADGLRQPLIDRACTDQHPHATAAPSVHLMLATPAGHRPAKTR